YIESAAGFNSTLFRHARSLVRAAAGREKPNELRLREYADPSVEKLSASVLSKAPIHPAHEKLTSSCWLDKMREYLGPDDPIVRQLLSSESPDSLAAKLIDETKLADPEVRKQLWEGGSAAVQSSTDPMIVLARSIDEEARAVRK